MSSIGYLQVNAYTSFAKIPLQYASIAVTDQDNQVIAFRLTNRNGQLDNPLTIEVPDRTESLFPNPPEQPYGVVNIYARAENYELIYIENIQIFAGTQTDQNLEFIPLSEYPESFNKSEIFITTPQAL